MKTYFILSVAVVVLSTSCKQADKFESPKVSAVQFAPPTAKADNEIYASVEKAPEFVADSEGNADIKVEAPVVTQKIIKQGDISFETADVKATRQQIMASLNKFQGYMESDEESNDGQKEYTLEIRIPARNFDTFLSSVAATATKIDSKHVSIKDVTTQFIDTKTRLDNKKILEGRYLELLKRASKISEMLEIENKLAEIRADIESNQGQLNYLSKQVAYSSLTIKFYTTAPSQVETSVGFGYRIKDALGNGFNTLQGLFFSILSAWPYWFFLLAVYLIIRRWRRNRKIAKAV